MARIRDLVIDCRHPAPLARFWAAVLEDYRVAPYDEAELARLRAIGVDDPEDDPSVLLEPRAGGRPRIFFTAVPEPKSVKNRVHLDLDADDFAAELDRLAGLGAAQVAEHEDLVVLADPEGNEFCLVRDPATG
ncbi:VOC family protein [Pseudonocardia humida]|uniref:VOC family protein n=1 Tax=Pseudonocardia humida TaxID=2800819 RepID=A0ABT0ZZL6_9PSEU|nr:VOC family protein [Pseudonocardia humida]MCO1656069.1 VOC family protein [Pseudonocardia humida]